MSDPTRDQLEADLLRAARRIGLARDDYALRQEIPRTALGLVPADLSLLFQKRGRMETLGRFGPSDQGDRLWLESCAEQVIASGRPQMFDHPDVPTREGRGRLIAAPVRMVGGKGAIVVARTTSHSSLHHSQVIRLALFSHLAGLALTAVKGSARAEVLAGQLEHVSDLVSGGLVLLDPALRIMAVNSFAAQLLGVDAEAVVERSLVDLDEGPAIKAFLQSPKPIVDRGPVKLATGPVKIGVRSWDGGTALVLEAADLPPATRGHHVRFAFEDLVAEDPRTREVIDKARRAATSDATILITGETGTGKELLAQAVHAGSRRARHPFVAINVAAIPSELLEAELFGYEAGAFTGARESGRQGRFELAGRGTLLLDEIGEMSPQLQSKLLRVLQEMRVERLGGTTPLAVHARIVATTNRDLEKEVAAGRFRADLFYRLNVVHLNLPPLRRRPMDVPKLIDRYARRACDALGRPPVRISPTVLAQLRHYPWPGNIRELANLMTGTVSLLPPGVEEIIELPIFESNPEYTPVAAPMRSTADGPGAEAVIPLEIVERRAIERALIVFAGNRSQAAKALGLGRTTLYSKIKQYGIET
ncbi:MAG: sigma 54-interacting transcriptional regulator [Proteobacteria bacterium]|nr:sigma 54-interacting transcriptional regulator [Pseudomonadota bacterium]